MRQRCDAGETTSWITHVSAHRPMHEQCADDVEVTGAAVHLWGRDMPGARCDCRLAVVALHVNVVTLHQAAVQARPLTHQDAAICQLQVLLVRPCRCLYEPHVEPGHYCAVPDHCPSFAGRACLAGHTTHWRVWEDPEYAGLAVLQVTSAEEQEFRRFWAAHAAQPLVGRNKILSSICPQLHGLFLVKLATALMLIGGVAQRDPQTGARCRSELHMLLVGDPGTGASDHVAAAVRTVAGSTDARTWNETPCNGLKGSDNFNKLKDPLRC